MKKLHTLITVLISFIATAQYVPTAGNLTIFSENGEKFYTYLNGELINNNPQINLRIENLNQRYYNVKIVFENKGLKDISKNYVSVIGKDGVTFGETTYKIKINPKTKKTRMNYFSSTPIIPDFVPPTDVFVVNSQAPTNPDVMINNGINININTNNSSNSNRPNNRHPRKPRCPEMSNSDFQIAKNTIAKESFDDDKLAIIQNLISNNCFRSSQIAEIAKMFSFSQNQMTFVKNAYNSCIDTKNYYLLKDTFVYPNDKEEFMNFINSKN